MEEALGEGTSSFERTKCACFSDCKTPPREEGNRMGEAPAETPTQWTLIQQRSEEPDNLKSSPSKKERSSKPKEDVLTAKNKDTSVVNAHKGREKRPSLPP